MTEHRGQTATQRKTLQLYRDMEQRRDEAMRERLASDDGDAPLERLRHTTTKDGVPTIDTSRADPECERCGGTGRRPDRVVGDGEDAQVVPVVCACVHRRGGVKKDLLDKLAAQAARVQRREERLRRRRREKNRRRRKLKRRAKTLN